LVGHPAPQINGPCPATPINTLAVEDFYANLVNEIGGQCVSTTTILSDPNADPHEFQPTAGDVRLFHNAQLVVENGLGYDDFAEKVLATLPTPPVVINAGDVLDLQVGANPHVWYSPGDVDRIRAAIVAELKQLNPPASAYYDAQSAALDQEFATYDSLIDQIATHYSGVPVGATETIFAGMAAATGLNVISPPQLMQAVSEGNEPTARQVATFHDQITSHQIKVLIYNTQTVTGVTEQLQALAQQNNIPMVGVSETLPQGAQTFQGWQATELEMLLQALQQSASNS
jgi:zinc/manganese transport system substrate-binding protein